MSLPLSFLFSLAILWLAAGCEIDRVLTIKPDGSGQIHERFLASRESYEARNGEAPEKQPNAKDEKTGAATAMTIDPHLKRPTAELSVKQAAAFGEGVEVISFKRIETPDMLGYEAVYEFSDVTKIHADAFLQGYGGAGASGEKPAPDDTSRNFQFTKGEVNELRLPLKLARGKVENPGKSDEVTADPKQREGFAKAMEHINIRTAIRVRGKIDETNSHFRKDNEVVVSEMNLKGLAADPKYAQDFKDAEAGKTSPTQPPPDDRYIKNEDLDVLTIRFH